MVAVYNTAPYLAETLDSLLGQTFTDLEVVAIDDGSTDGSADILRQYAQRDPRLRFASRENRGIAVTRNEMLAMARGRLLAVNDSDDVSVPDRIAEQIKYMDAHPEIVCLGGDFEYMDAVGRKLTTLRPPRDDAAIQQMLMRGHASICNGVVMMRREAVERVGGYHPDYRFGQDVDMFLKLGEVGKLANMPRTLGRIRLHGKSVSETKREEQRHFGRLACEAAAARRGVPCAFDASEPWRPGADRGSRHLYLKRYGWWAFNSGERRTAMIYGMKTVAAKPWDPAGWKLMACAALKPIPAEAPSA